jgi:hypothetical protein
MAGLVAVGGAGGVVSACSHNDSTIFIYHVVDPGQTTPGVVCPAPQANPTAPFISQGELDTAISPSGFFANFLVGNQLVGQADPTIPRTETSFFNVQGAIVRITASDGSALATYSNLASATIAPASGGTPGYATVGVVLLDSSVIPLTPGVYVTYTKVFGKTLGGQYIESNEFEFPISVCRGCLVQFSAADINLLCTPIPNCVGSGSATTTNMSVPCFPGQAPTDCSACDPSVPECNPPVRCIGLDGGVTD